MACALLAVASWGQRNSSYLKAIIPAAGFNVAIAAGSILLIISISGVIGTVGSFYKYAFTRSLRLQVSSDLWNASSLSLWCT